MMTKSVKVQPFFEDSSLPEGEKKWKKTKKENHRIQDSNLWFYTSATQATGTS